MKKGFTIIELLILIAIVGIIVTIVYVSIRDDDGAEQIIETSNTRIITAYSLDSIQTDDSPCIGAWGDNLCELQANNEFVYSICASNEFGRGTKLRIRGNLLNFIDCIVLDRMSEKYPTRIDILMESYVEALNFGIMELKVKVLKQ